MPHGYCTECRAQVTVRSGRCLLDHTVDSSTVVDTPGRRLKPDARRNPLHRLTARVAPPFEHHEISHRESVAVGAVALLEREDTRIEVTLPVEVPAAPLPPPLPPSPPAEDALSVTGYLVEELWNLSPDDDIDDWSPNKVDSSLIRNGLRTRMVWGAAVLVIVVGLVSWRALTWDSARFDEVAASIDASSARLATAINGLDPVIDDVADGIIDDALGASTALGRVDGEARALFSLAGELPEIEESIALRDATLVGASAALEVESTLSSVVAYAAAVGLIPDPPALPSEVDLPGLQRTTEALTNWSASFRDAVDTLPTNDLTDTHRAALSDLAVSVPDWQADYLDALRGRDVARAEAAVGQLQTQMEFIRSSWDGTAAAAAAWAKSAADRANPRI